MNDNFSDLIETGYDVLEHHGIKGQRWGKQNGPPYPLNAEGRAAFKKQVKKFKAAAKKKLDKKLESDRKYRIVEKQKRADKRKRKIMSDPKKLYKHRAEFTTDEIYDAIDKIQAIDELKDIGGLNETKEKGKKKVELTKKQKRLANSYTSLLANMDKFSPEELELAKQRASDRDYMKNKIASATHRPADVLENVAKGTQAITNTAKNLTGLHDNIVNFSGGTTSEDKHKAWLYNNVDPKSGRRWSELLGEVNTAMRGQHNNYVDEITRNNRYERNEEREQKRYNDYQKQLERTNQFNEKIAARGIEYAYNFPEKSYNAYDFSGYQVTPPSYNGNNNNNNNNQNNQNNKKNKKNRNRNRNKNNNQGSKGP